MAEGEIESRKRERQRGEGERREERESRCVAGYTLMVCMTGSQRLGTLIQMEKQALAESCDFSHDRERSLLQSDN